MDDKRTERNEEVEIDLQRLFQTLWSRKWLILATSVVCAVVTLAVTFFLITPEYQSSVMFYVNNGVTAVDEIYTGISSGDILASKSLVESYIVILDTRETRNEIIAYSGVNRTDDELAEMITAAAVNATEIIKVDVTSTDPAEAEKVANAIAVVLPDRVSTIIEGATAKVVDYAVVAAKPSSPDYILNTIIGFVIGFALMAIVILMRETYDTTIRMEEDIAPNCEYPVLVAVPDMQAPSKSGYDYGYNRKGKYSSGANPGRKTALIGGGISFAAAESYKLLRTKLQFSFVGDGGSRVIGISSALSGEGKSLTAINLGYTLAQLDKKVVLIDCDMRRPTLAEKLRIQKYPGLSNYLTGQNRLEELVQNCGIRMEEDAFYVISAGQSPPNPIELLSSSRMAELLDSLRQIYDYVILDLPPVGEVSDALAVAKETDGILLVVRQNYCNRVALKDTIHHFEFVNARIVGVVFNCVVEGNGRFRKGYDKKYYSRYGKKYEGAYRAAAKAANRTPMKRVGDVK